MKFSRTGTQSQQPRRRTEQPVADQPQPVSQFRRNQTLTSRRPSHPDQVSGRSQLHSLTAHRRKVTSVFLLILGASLLLAIILTQFTARVSIASSSKPITQAVTATSYIDAINEYYAVHPVERLRFLLNEEALTQSVAASHPEIEKLSLSSITKLVEAGFTIQFRESIAGWQINNRQYYVDNEGVVFEENYGTQPKVQIIDESGVSPTQGTTVASARLLGFVGRLVSDASTRGYAVTSVTLPVGTTRQLAIRLDGVGGYVLFTIDRGVAEQVEDMSRALKHLKDTGQAIEYVDVRIEGRAVYR